MNISDNESAWFSGGNQIKRLVVSRKCESFLHFGVMESSHAHGPQAQRHSFQQQVLGGMAGLKMHVSMTAGCSVFLRRALIDSSHHKNSFRFPDGLLSERGMVKRRPQIVCRDAIQAMPGRIIMVKAHRQNHINLEWIQGAG